MASLGSLGADAGNRQMHEPGCVSIKLPWTLDRVRNLHFISFSHVMKYSFDFFFFGQHIKMWKLFSWVVGTQVACRIGPTGGSVPSPALNEEGASRALVLATRPRPERLSQATLPYRVGGRISAQKTFPWVSGEEGNF